MLMPEAPDSIYERLSIVPRDMMDDLKKARIVITNFHAFKRKQIEIAKGTAEVLRGRDNEDEFDERFRENDGQLIQRIMAPLMGRRGIVVLNDEAHRCYEEKPEPETTVDRAEDETAAEAKADAEENNKVARLWINGIRTVQRVPDIKTVYDLSATPFFLRGSGYREGELFGWVVSNFSLMDAIECGIVMVPQVPTRDDVNQANAPVFRHLYKHARKDLPPRFRLAAGRSRGSRGFRSQAGYSQSNRCRAPRRPKLLDDLRRGLPAACGIDFFGAGNPPARRTGRRLRGGIFFATGCGGR